jgi:hypothetical protein
MTAETPVLLETIPLRIDPDEVWAFHRHAGRPAAADAAARLDEATGLVTRSMRPRATWRVRAVERVEPDALWLRDGARLEIPGIAGHWGAVEAVAAAVVTIGAAVELAGDEWRDIAASAAVECLAEWVNDHLCQSAVANGRRATNRISPGLAGWDLCDQGALLAGLPLAALGIALHPDGTLSPSKSISLLVGLGPSPRVDHYFTQCRRCWASACPARRAARTASVSATETGGTPWTTTCS